MKSRKTVRIEKIGRVFSAKMNKSRTVVVEGRSQHPFYKKYIKSRRKFMAHDEVNLSKEGDLVRIVRCRPISKSKKWKIAEVLGKGENKENGTVDVNSNGSR